MSENTTEYLSSRHKQLLNIATAARVFAWITLVVEAFLSISRFSYFIYLDRGFSHVIRPFSNIESFLSLYSPLMNGVSCLVQGGVAWLLLMGISVGLSILVETDLNYRDKQSEEAA